MIPSKFLLAGLVSFALVGGATASAQSGLPLEGTSDSDSARGYRVGLSADGVLTVGLNHVAASGKSEPVENVRVKVTQANRIIARATRAPEGVARLEGVAPGTYTLTARSPRGMATIGIQVVAAGDQQAGVQLMLVNNADVTSVADLLRKGDRDLISRFASKSELPVDAFGIDPQSAVRQLTVTIPRDGRFYGRVYSVDGSTGQPVVAADSWAFALSSGNVVAVAQGDEEGRFVLDGLGEGYYTVVTRSASGASVFGLETRFAKGSLADAKSLKGGTHFVYDAIDVPPPVEILETPIVVEEPIEEECIEGDCYEEEIVEIYPPIEEFAPLPPPLAPPAGGGFGGGFGGGGFGGGFGGLGAAIGAGGLAAGIAALVDDDDDDGAQIIIPVSPVAPIVVP